MGEAPQCQHMLDWRNMGGGLTSHPGLTFYVGLKNFWKIAELIDYYYDRTKSDHFSFWLGPYMVHFYSANQKSRFFKGVLHTNRGSQVAELAKMTKRAKMADFGKFLKNRPTGANKGSKIIYRVIFFGTLGYVPHKYTFVAWFPWVTTTCYHF